MLDSLPYFLSDYGLYLAGVAVLCGVASYFSETFFKNLKKGLVIVAVVFCVVAAYELITGNSIFTLPSSVDKKMSEQPGEGEGAANYYGKSKLKKAEFEGRNE